MPKFSKMATCYVLFGSNLGDKETIFTQACLLINNRCGAIRDVSAAYESEPWGFETKEWFLNRVIVLETDLVPEDLLDALLQIEAELGRVRYPDVKGYASRTADLDILYYDDRVIRTKRLVVPHLRLHLRRFALMPMCKVAPELVHPVLHMTQLELLRHCPDNSFVREICYQSNEKQ